MGKSKDINSRPDRAAAEAAVRTLIRWAGDDPDRPGLQDTPARVAEFYCTFFAGYAARAADFSASVAPAVSAGDFVLVNDIAISSFCEHHMLPAAGTAAVAYAPGAAVAGIGAIARLAAVCAARLTTQEALSDDIAAMMQQAFAPRGVAVLTRLRHGCITLRAPGQKDSTVSVLRYTGVFSADLALQSRFLALAGAAPDASL